VRLRRSATILVSVVLLALVAGCGEPAPKTDAELGLTVQQASGRRIFERDCAACHNAYSSSGSKGPSLKGLYKKQFLPSGLPANDRFVEQTIVSGRGMMPALSDPITGQLSDQQLDDMVAYLHTL
jgi:mono/diheme cytochrome c family protein